MVFLEVVAELRCARLINASRSGLPTPLCCAWVKKLEAPTPKQADS
jgi:hypothetical protein